VQVAVDRAEAQLPELVRPAGPDRPVALEADEVLVPGEPEQRERRRREAEGVPVPEKTWEAITKTATELGVPEAMPKLG
jgi:LDH2 family malate/lactate/ureidoglycolate dehydrogenase